MLSNYNIMYVNHMGNTGIPFNKPTLLFLEGMVFVMKKIKCNKINPSFIRCVATHIRTAYYITGKIKL